MKKDMQIFVADTRVNFDAKCTVIGANSRLANPADDIIALHTLEALNTRMAMRRANVLNQPSKIPVKKHRTLS
jgi:hypothetical protein